MPTASRLTRGWWWVHPSGLHPGGGGVASEGASIWVGMHLSDATQMDAPSPHVDRQTRVKNITLPYTSYASG